MRTAMGEVLLREALEEALALIDSSSGLVRGRVRVRDRGRGRWQHGKKGGGRSVARGRVACSCMGQGGWGVRHRMRFLT